MSRQRCQHRRTKHPVLDVPALWPGIGKKDEHARHTHGIGKTVQELPYFRPHETQIIETRKVLLAERSPNPVRPSVDTQTKLFRVLTGIVGQEMAMPTSQFKGD